MTHTSKYGVLYRHIGQHGCLHFLGKITRNLALNKWEHLNAEKRGSGQTIFALAELQECIPSADNTENIVDDLALVEVLNRFLGGLSKERRIIFMRRYWYFCSIKEIASSYSISESKVKMSLMRSRNELRNILEKEGIVL